LIRELSVRIPNPYGAATHSEKRLEAQADLLDFYEDKHKRHPELRAALNNANLTAFAAFMEDCNAIEKPLFQAEEEARERRVGPVMNVFSHTHFTSYEELDEDEALRLRGVRYKLTESFVAQDPDSIDEAIAELELFYQKRGIEPCQQAAMGDCYSLSRGMERYWAARMKAQDNTNRSR